MVSAGAVSCAARGPIEPESRSLAPSSERTRTSARPNQSDPRSRAYPCARTNPTRRVRTNARRAEGFMTRAPERTQAAAKSETVPTRAAGLVTVAHERTQAPAQSERTRASPRPNEPEARCVRTNPAVRASERARDPQHSWAFLACTGANEPGSRARDGRRGARGGQWPALRDAPGGSCGPLVCAGQRAAMRESGAGCPDRASSLASSA